MYFLKLLLISQVCSGSFFKKILSLQLMTPFQLMIPYLKILSGRGFMYFAS